MSQFSSRREVLKSGARWLPAAALTLAGCKSAESATHTAEQPKPKRDAREVSLLLDATPTIEGAGVRLRRSLGTRVLSELDPFLLLDEIHSDRLEDYVKGFPTHPHRGFETVTYVIDGYMEHRDSLGQGGQLVAGSAQWMTAGRGIVHSEMPNPDGRVFWGLQLWVNLPAKHKLSMPRYQNVAPDRIPELSVRGAPVRLVAGALGSERGPVDGISVAPTMLDVRLPARGTFEHELPREHTLFAYVLEGQAELGAARRSAQAGQIAVFGPGQVLTARSTAGARLLLVAGQKIGESIARRGPFVMNTQAELDRAYEDYRNGVLVSG
ncbi:MAG TPA: pirin family protein [Polyangiaceae bacterium]|nr:pirin family protein [Polyangiaceae bacterium]HYQ26457.1 pirin family protein [Polyangiaceae bacterium]